MNLFVVRIDKTHPYNFGDPPKKEYIKGAASACWRADYKKLSNCNYLIAVYENKIVGVFEIEKVIRGFETSENETLLKDEITYPPYRKYEIDAHDCASAEEIKNKLREHISIFEKVVKVDIDNPKEFSAWKNRCFLILEDCDKEKLNSLVGKELPYKAIYKKFNSHTYCCLEE